MRLEPIVMGFCALQKLFIIIIYYYS